MNCPACGAENRLGIEDVDAALARFAELKPPS
jgi:hypothetical protein